MNKHTAIITDVRFRMSLAIIRDIAQMGVKVIAVECNDKTPPLGFYSRYVSEKYFFEVTAYKDELYSLCERVRNESGEKPVLIPVGTATLNMLSDAETGNKFSEVCGFCIPSKDQIELLNDKKRLSEYAKACGVPVPEDYSSAEDVDSFPCVVKPVCGEKFGIKAKDRYKIVNSKSELDAAVSDFLNKCDGQSPVVQQYIKGDGFGCSVLACSGKIKSSIMHRRLREYPVSGGPSACCELVDIPELSEYAGALISEMNYTGIAMFEFKGSESEGYFLLECNPRVWGSYPLTRVSDSGFSEQWFAESFAKGNPGKEITLPEKRVRRVKMHYAFSDLCSGAGYIKRGMPAKGLSAIFSILDPTVKHGLFEIGDAKPAIEYIKGIVKRE